MISTIDRKERRKKYREARLQKQSAQQQTETREIIVGATLSPLDYVELALNDPNFGDARRDKLAIAALKFAGDDGELKGGNGDGRKKRPRIKEDRQQAAEEVASNGIYQTRVPPGEMNGIAPESDDEA